MTTRARRVPSTHPVNQKMIDEAPLGVRIADGVTGFMGSWRFIIIQTIIVVIWIVGNVILLFHFDPYPFILLNLCLSCLAAMQGAILLIAAKRQDQISSELAQHDYETNVEADRIVKSIHELTVAIHGRVVGEASTPATPRPCGP